MGILLVASSNSFSPNSVISTHIRSASAWTSSSLYSTIEPSPTTPPTPVADATAETAVADATTTTETVTVSTTTETATETATTETATISAETATTSPETATVTATPETPKPGITNDQEKYGVSLELPDTYVRCGQCAAAFAIKPDDLGARGRRISCSICPHSWYQTPDRLFNLKEGNKLSTLPAHDLERIAKNIEAGRDPDFMGTSKFYVGNLSFTVTEEDLRQVFAEVGPVGSVSVAVGPDGRVKGFAFVTMMEEDSYDGCLALDGMDIHGRNISVKPPNN